MERRETQENVDVRALIKRAGDIFLRQDAGETVDQEEIEQLRRDARSFADKREFEDFRVAVGTLALQEKLNLNNKDAGSGMMELIFGEGDARLFNAVKVLTVALDMNFRDYSVTTMLNIYYELEERLKKNGKDFSKQLVGGQGSVSLGAVINHARRTLSDFLTQGAGVRIKEQIILRQEAGREEIFTRDFERAMLAGKSKEEILSELESEGARIENLWNMLKQAPFEQAPFFLNSIGFSKKLINLLKAELKESRKPQKEGPTEPILSPDGEVARSWGLSLLRLAKQLRSDIEDARYDEDKSKLETRASQYEARANDLLNSLQASSIKEGVK